MFALPRCSGWTVRNHVLYTGMVLLLVLMIRFSTHGRGLQADDRPRQNSRETHRMSSPSPAHNESLTVTAADYAVTRKNNRVLISAELCLRQETDKPQQLALNVGRQSVESAHLNGQPAILKRSFTQPGRIVLLHDSAGTTTLKLQLSAPLTTVGPAQRATIHFPVETAATCRVSVKPGEVLFINGRRLKRPASSDEPAVYRFPAGNRKTISLRFTTNDAAEPADTEPTDTVTLAESRIGLRLAGGIGYWQSETELQCSGRRTGHLAVSFPGRLKLTRVQCRDLAEWTIDEAEHDDGHSTLHLRFRSKPSGRRMLRLRGLLLLPIKGFWNVPYLHIDGADAHTGNITVTMPREMPLRVDEYSGLRERSPAGRESSVQSPETFGTGPETLIPRLWTSRPPCCDAPAERTLAFDFHRQDYELALVIPERRFLGDAAASTRLTVERRAVRLAFQAEVTVWNLPQRLRISLPAGWSSLRIAVKGRPVRWTSRPVEAAVQHIDVHLPEDIRRNDNRVTWQSASGTTRLQVELRARHQLEFSDDNNGNGTAQLPLPEVRIDGVRRMLGRLSVQADDRFDVSAAHLKRLNPVAGQSRDERLSYRYAFRPADRPGLSGVLRVAPVTGTASVLPVLFIRAGKRRLHARHEFIIRPAERGRPLTQLQLELPVSVTHPQITWTGTEAQFVSCRTTFQVVPDGLNNHPTKDTAGDGASHEATRRWLLRFDRAIESSGVLSVRLTTPHPTDRGRPGSVTVPRVTIHDVERQSGYVAVGASSGRHLTVSAIASRSHKSQGNPERLRHVSFAELPNAVQLRISASESPLPAQEPGPQTKIDWGEKPGFSRRLTGIYETPSVNHTIQVREVRSLPATGNVVVADDVSMSTTLTSEPERQVTVTNRAAFSLNRRDVHSLLVHLPEGSRLLHARVDGDFVSVRRRKKMYAISLSSSVVSRNSDRCTVELTFRAPLEPLPSRRRLQLSPPQLHVLTTDGTQRRIVARECDWSVCRPADVSLVSAGNGYHPLQRLDSTSWLAELFGATAPQDAKRGRVMRFRRFDARQNALAPLELAYDTPTADILLRLCVLSGTVLVFWWLHRFGRSTRSRFRLAALATAGIVVPAVVAYWIAPVYRAYMDGLFAGAVAGSLLWMFPPLLEWCGAGIRRLGMGGSQESADAGGQPNQQNGLRISHLSDHKTSAQKTIACFLLSAIIGSTVASNAPADDAPSVFAKQLVDQQPVSRKVSRVDCAHYWVRGDGFAKVGEAHPAALTHQYSVLYSVLHEPMGGSFGVMVCSAEVGIDATAALQQGDRAARVTARYAIVSFRDRPTQVAVPLGAVPLRSATLSGQPAVLTCSSLGNQPTMDVLIPRRGRYVLQLEFDVPVTRTGNVRRFVLPVQPVPAGRAVLRLPSTETHVVVRELNASRKACEDGCPERRRGSAFRAGAPATVRPPKGNVETRGLPFDGAFPPPFRIEQAGAVVEFPIDRSRGVSIALQPAGKRRSRPPVVQLRRASRVAIHHHGLLQRDEVTLNARRGKIAQWTFTLPAETKLTDISGRDVAGWTIVDANTAGRTVRVKFRRPLKSTSLWFHTYRHMQFAAQTTRVTLTGVQSTAGETRPATLQVWVTDGLSVRESTLQGACRITRVQPHTQNGAESVGRIAHALVPLLARPQSGDELRLGTASVGQAVRLTHSKLIVPVRSSGTTPWVYRLDSPQGSVTLDISRPRSRASLKAVHDVLIGRDRLQLHSRWMFDISGSPRSKIAMFLPEGFTLHSLREVSHGHSEERSDGTASWTLGEDGMMLFITFPEPRQGRVVLEMRGALRRDPASTTADIILPSTLAAQRMENVMGVRAAPGWNVAPGETEGWTRRPVSEWPATLLPQTVDRPRLVYRGSYLEPAPLGLNITPDTSSVRGNTFTRIHITETELRYTVLLHWAGVTARPKSVALTVPEWFGERLTFCEEGDKPTQTIQRDLGSDVPKGRMRYIISDFAPSGEDVATVFTARIPLRDSRVRTPSLVLESLKNAAGAADPASASVTPVETVKHFVAVRNESSQQLAPMQTSGLTPLPEDAVRERLARIPGCLKSRASLHAPSPTNYFQLNQQHDAPTWRLQRKPAPVNTDVVSRAVLTTRLRSDGTYRLRALYRVQNSSREFLAVRIPSDSHVSRVTVAGRTAEPVQVERNDRRYHLVPLPMTAGSDDGIDVTLTLSGRFDASASGIPFALSGERISLPVPEIVSKTEHREWGFSVGSTTWTVHMPPEMSASVATDAERTNVAPVSKVESDGVHVFEKSGGAPRLALTIETPEHRQKSWHLFASLAWIAAGGVALLAIRRSQTTRR